MDIGKRKGVLLVVIPVCKKDEELVLKNLEWAAELDRTREEPIVAIVSCPEGFKINSIVQAVKNTFHEHYVVRYPDWGGDPKWPNPQNWAWQSTARWMAAGRSNIPWLWWEADATPVKKGWVEAIAKEYFAARKPFMGCLMDGEGFDGHMNGVAVYPANVPSYTTNAMLCRNSPFDIVLWPDIAHVTHKANHLIQNHVVTDGDSTHFPDAETVKEIVRPGVVLFHRCKDGSLIDQLRNPTHSGKKKSWFAFRKSKHDKEWPSILKQTKWEAGFFNLPSHERECHFNCAIVEQAGALWLVSRRWRRSPPSPWQSDIVRHKLDDKFNILESYPIILPKQRGPMEQHEDPRIIRRDEGFTLAYCSWLMGAKFQAHQNLAALDSGWNCLNTFHLRYGKNGAAAGLGLGHEKNWTWFYHEKALFMDYQFSPHTVVKVASESQVREFVAPTPLAEQWKHGHIRGGTPPVRVGDEYISFFHSSLHWRGRQNRYFMGAYAFEAKPPFAVTRITPKPLLGGSEDDPRSLGGPLVVFPCAGITNRDEFLVTLGVNDQACAWIRIPMGELNNRLSPT